MRLPRIRSFVALVAVLMVVVAFAASAARAAGPSIERSPGSGPPGTTVTISGAGFQPGEIVDLYFDERDLTVVVAGNQGRVVDVVIDVPRGTSPGTHWFTMVGRRTGRSAQAGFDVTPAVWSNWPQRDGDAARTGSQLSDRYLSADTAGALTTAWTADGWGSPLVVGRTAIVLRSSGFESSAIVALDAWTGATLWTREGFYEVSLSTWDDSLLVSSGRSVTAMSLATGSTEWSRNVGPRQAWSWGSPVVSGDALYATYDGEGGPGVVGYDLRGLEPIWETMVQGENRWINSPLSTGGGVVVGGFGEGLVAFDAGTGGILWQRPSAGYANSLVVSSDRVVSVVQHEERAWVESRVLTTGALDWQANLGTAGSNYTYAEAPAVASGAVVVTWGSEGGSPSERHVTAFDASTGTLRWDREMETFSAPSIVNGMVFLPADDGRMYVLELSSGDQLAAPMLGNGGGRPAIANGTAYVPGWSGTLYAVRTPGALRAEAAALVPKAGSVPDRTDPIEPITGGWSDVASLSRAAGVAATSATEFHGVLYIGTSLEPNAAGSAQILRSEDGVSFTQAASFPGSTAVAVESFGGRLYAATTSPGGASMEASTDGAVFATIEGLPSGREIERYLPAAVGSRMLVTADTSTGIRMWWSGNGVTFTESERTDEASAAGRVVAEPFAPYEHGVVFEGMRYIGVRSPDGAELWRTIDGTRLERVALTDLSVAPWRSVEPQAVFEGSMYVVVTTPGRADEPPIAVYRTADGGAFERVTLAGVSTDPGRYASAQIAEVDGRLILVSGNRDPRRFTATGPIDTELLHGLQVFASDDGAAWRRAAEPGFGDPHDWSGSLLVAERTAYLAVTNHREGDAVWRSPDGLAWQPMFREAGRTRASLGPVLTLFQGHLLLLHGDLHGLTVYRTDEAVAATGGEPTATGWIAIAIAVVATLLAVGFVVITATRRRHRPAHRGPMPHAA